MSKLNPVRVAELGALIDKARAFSISRLTQPILLSDLIFAVCDLANEVENLRARVAELEPDAKLGRMVREMPLCHHLFCEINDDGEQHWALCRWITQKTIGSGDTPEAALEAAKEAR